MQVAVSQPPPSASNTPAHSTAASPKGNSLLPAAPVGTAAAVTSGLGVVPMDLSITQVRHLVKDAGST